MVINWKRYRKLVGSWYTVTGFGLGSEKSIGMVFKNYQTGWTSPNWLVIKMVPGCKLHQGINWLVVNWLTYKLVGYKLV